MARPHAIHAPPKQYLSASLTHPKRNEFLRFILLAVLGIVASYLSINIPNTEVFFDVRWVFGFLGFVLLQSFWSALLLAILLSLAGLHIVPTPVALAGNLMYALPELIVIRFVYGRFLTRIRQPVWLGIAWLALIMICYQLFHHPMLWGLLAFFDDKSIWAGIVDGWVTQPFLIESLLVGVVSGLVLTAYRISSALRTSQRELAITLYSIGDGVIATDTAGRVRRMNPVAEELTGWREAEAIGRELDTVFQIVNEETGQTVESPVNRVLREGRVVGLANHTVLRSRDGTKRPIVDSGAPIRNEDLDIRGVVIVFRDQSEERAQQRSIEESHERLSLALHNANMGVWEWHIETNRIDWHGEHAALFGLAENDFKGTPEDIRKMLHPDDLELVMAQFSETIQKGIDFDQVYRIIRPDGQIRWLHSSGKRSPKTGNNPERMVGTTHDITDRKQIENALRESEARYRSLTENFPNGALFLFNDEFRYLAANGKGFAQVGLVSEEVVGKTVKEIFPELWDVIRPYLEGALRGEEGYYEAEFRGKLYSNQVLPIFDEQGHIGQGIVIAMDITEQRQAEEKIKAALAEKEALLRELYHRTKNNMQIIRAMLVLQAQNSDHPEVRKLVEETEHRISAMALVHQKLYQAQDLSNIDLQEYLSELAALLMRSYRVSCDRVQLKLDLQKVPMLIDTAIPCGLIVNELMSNALKHGFSNGQQGEIRIQLHRSDSGEIKLCFEDTGQGVPEGFDFFQQESLGVQTIISLVEHQLQGAIAFDTRHGVACNITFKEGMYERRV